VQTNRDVLARWLAEAAYHNRANGINTKDMPPYLARYLRGPAKRPDGAPRGKDTPKRP
jgi:hypothetical protein